MAVGEGVDLRVEVNVRSAAFQRAHHPGARLVPHLGQNAAPGLDQVEGQLVTAQLRIRLQHRRRERQQFSEALDSGEPATHERHGQQPSPLGAGRQERRLVERGHQPVADGHRLFDVLQTDRVLRKPRDGEGAGHGSRR